MIYENDNYDSKIGKLLGALCVIVALFGGCWFFAYHAYVMAPTTEAITITLPPELQASNAPAQTIEIERPMPGREYFSALLHPFGFMVLLLVIIGAGGGLILRLGRGQG